MMSHDVPKQGFLCSFCGKTEWDIEYMITGPGVCICDECVETCENIIKEWRVKEYVNKRRKELFDELWWTDV